MVCIKTAEADNGRPKPFESHARMREGERRRQKMEGYAAHLLRRPRTSLPRAGLEDNATAYKNYRLYLNKPTVNKTGVSGTPDRLPILPAGRPLFF
jgi:hypothetical protein